MSETDTTNRPSPRLVRHPVRGALWGLLLGIGAAMFAMLYGLFELLTWTGPIIVVVAGIAVGVLWAMFAPAKRAPAP